MWAPLPPEPPAKGWWTEVAERQAEADLDRWVEKRVAGIAGRRAAEAEREARAARVRLGTAMHACRAGGHRLCGAPGHGPCNHSALAGLVGGVT